MVFHIFGFFKSCFGLNYINSEILREDDSNKVEFSRNLSLLKLAFNNEIWKNILLYYSYYIQLFRKNVRGNKDLTCADKEERTKTY
jgi:hypothetical protein